MYRIGIGWDQHAFGAHRPLKLGGAEIPFGRGLEGHSDADVPAHAVCDALLGAAGLPDLGVLFPDCDPELKEIDGMVLLKRVFSMVARKGYEVENVDCVIMAQEPRISPFFDKMKSNIAAAIGVEPERIGIKASSPEGLGAVGRGEGIAAQAVVLLISKPAEES